MTVMKDNIVIRVTVWFVSPYDCEYLTTFLWMIICMDGYLVASMQVITKLYEYL
jgi:hypothetical protein